ncbi:MAG TPA: aldo/keto reductase, partial [Dehalococcoidia bacterium]|nr:aldo/keto reductase [Dehalococcoidia bacterium]
MVTSSMEYRRLGNSELHASVIGLGGNTFGPPRIDKDMALRCIHAAQDLGVNFLDTASGYGEGKSEEFVGAALEGRRDHWLVATKFNFRGRGERSVREWVNLCCESSLRKLSTDYLDLFQLHQPSPEIPEDELLRAYDALIKGGKVREIGASNHYSWHVA